MARFFDRTIRYSNIMGRKVIILVMVILYAPVVLVSQTASFCERNVSEDIAEKYHILDSAFKLDNHKLKKDFFINWFEQSEQYANAYLVDNEYHRLMNFVLTDIYYPTTRTKRYYDKFNIYDSLTKSMDSIKIQYDGCFMDAEYIIVQTKTKIKIYSDSVYHDMFYREQWYNQETIFDTIIDRIFPDLNYFDKPILYLTDDYQSALDLFIVCPENYRSKETYKRDLKRIFLQPEIEISKYHDGVFYHYVTFPEINTMQLDESFSKAIVHFRSSFNTGGVAKYEKIDGFWSKIKYEKVRWVQ
jgi:hypothetical protein